MAKSLEAALGISEGIPAGYTVTIIPLKPPESKVTPGSIAYHEALHVTTALLNGTRVILASIEPGPGYSGITILAWSDPEAAAAPDVMGCSGTGHDRWILIMQGHNPDFMDSSVRSRLAGQDEKIYVVASLLQDQTTITGAQAEEAMKQVDNPKVRVEVTNLLGEKWQFVTKLKSSLQGLGISNN